MRNEMIIARWESKSGKHWVELIEVEFNNKPSYSYRSVDCGGNLGYLETKDHAISYILNRLSDFQPDKNKMPMIRVK